MRCQGPPFLYTLTLFIAISGFLFGYDTGVVSGAMILLDNEFKLNGTWHSSIVSITMAFAAIFSLVGGLFNSRYGRQKTILFSSFLFNLGSLILTFAHGKFGLVIGRAILGMAIGMSSMTAGMYISEIAPPEIRGQLVTIQQVMITVGQFVAAFVDGLMSDQVNGWRWMFGLALLPGLVQFLGFLLIMPESPRWLLEHGFESQAHSVFRQINEANYKEEEFNQIRDKVKNLEGKYGKIEKEAISLGCLLQSFQQLAGINSVMYFSATIMKMTGVADSTAIWDAAKIALANMFFGLLGLIFIDRLGRRKLLLTSFFGCFLAMMLISRGMSGAEDVIDMNDFFKAVENSDQNITQSITTEEHNAYKSSSLAFIGMVIYLFAFSPGLGPVPWAVNSEIYAEEYSRNIGNSLATFCNWLFNFFVSFLFIPISLKFGIAVPFFIYGSFCLIGFILFYLFLPETKNITLEQVNVLFSPNRSRIVGSLICLPKFITDKFGYNRSENDYLAMS